MKKKLTRWSKAKAFADETIEKFRRNGLYFIPFRNLVDAFTCVHPVELPAIDNRNPLASIDRESGLEASAAFFRDYRIVHNYFKQIIKDIPGVELKLDGDPGNQKPYIFLNRKEVK